MRQAAENREAYPAGDRPPEGSDSPLRAAAPTDSPLRALYPADSPVRAGGILLMLLPAALTVYLAFNSGGVFPVTTAMAVLIVLVSILVALAAARWQLGRGGVAGGGVAGGGSTGGGSTGGGSTGRGLAGRLGDARRAMPRVAPGPGPVGSLVIALFALFALWTLLSGTWSHAPARALVAFDRVLLYLAVLALFACIPYSLARLRWLLRGLLVACAIVAVIGLISRLLPNVWPTAPGLDDERLSYPITYWNTFALLVGVGCILALHHASDEREPLAVRALAAALAPLLAATLLLTFSRGAIAVTAVGVLVYVVSARPRALAGALLAIVPTTAFAGARTYAAELVHRGKPLTPDAISQAHRLALVLAGCALAAALLRLALRPLDERLSALDISAARRRALALAAVSSALVLLLIALTAFHGASWAQDKYNRFVHDTPGSTHALGERTRLSYVGNDGRLPLWNVALDAYRQDPLTGSGAGTYRLEWERHQRGPADRVYPYSLYLGTLGELGLVGIVLLALVLLAIAGALIVRVRAPAPGSAPAPAPGSGPAPGRPAHAAALAVVLAWLIHAGLDLDWETPAVTVFVFALGGLALGRPGRRPETSRVEVDRKKVMVLRAYARARAAPLNLDTHKLPVLGLACLAAGIIPVQLALAQTHLRRSIDALNAGSCVTADAEARAAIARLDDSPRPYEVLAMCAARRSDAHRSIAYARTAVARDPDYWEPRYVLALAQASAGVDPRRAAHAAYVRHPSGLLARSAERAFNTNNAGQWQRAARTLPFSFD
ncbi:MAG TPA: O-antigen ligase family protein [Solirubrobacteraceae bacterium]|nr:O-antigen ligase family protein [Solirubrobacteraceae bacterium]